jgi:capsular polysaccharide biosynthesis protein
VFASFGADVRTRTAWVIGFFAMKLISLLIRHWLIASICGMLGVACAIAFALLAMTPSYVATLKLYVSGAGPTTGDQLQSSDYVRTHVASYTDMVDSNDVLVAVRDNLGLPQRRDGSYGDLADSITAVNPLGTVIIDVTVQAASPHQAQVVAAAIGEVYNPVVARLESPSGVKRSPVRINVVSPPALPKPQYSPSRKLVAAGGLLGGVAVGAGAAWLLELRPTTRRRLSVIDQASPDDWSSWWRDSTSPTVPPEARRGVQASSLNRGASNGNGASGRPVPDERSSADI